MTSNFQKANRKDSHYEDEKEEEQKARARIAGMEPDTTESGKRIDSEEAADRRGKKIHQGRI